MSGPPGAELGAQLRRGMSGADAKKLPCAKNVVMATVFAHGSVDPHVPGSSPGSGRSPDQAAARIRQQPGATAQATSSVSPMNAAHSAGVDAAARRAAPRACRSRRSGRRSMTTIRSARRRGGQPVRHHERGPPRGQLLGRPVDRGLRGQVQRRRGLVQQQDVRVDQLARARAMQLPLPGRQVPAALGDLVLVARRAAGRSSRARRRARAAASTSASVADGRP